MFPRDSTYVNVLCLVLYLGFSFGGFFGGFFLFCFCLALHSSNLFLCYISECLLVTLTFYFQS